MTTGLQSSKVVADPSARGPVEWDPKGEAVGSPEPRAPVEPDEAGKAPLQAGSAAEAFPALGEVFPGLAHARRCTGVDDPSRGFSSCASATESSPRIAADSVRVWFRPAHDP